MRAALKAGILALTLVMVVAVPARAQSSSDLRGLFHGVNDAEGAQIRLSPGNDDGFDGEFLDPRGASQSFKADWIAGGAEAVLDMDQRTVLMRMTPVAYGAEVLLVPLDQTGRLIAEASTFYTFVREGLERPPVPQGYVDPPTDPAERVAAWSFLTSYQFWPPTSVRNGYLSLADRFRTLTRLFAAVQLDLIWKLCLAPDADRALGVALRGQGVSCADVRAVIAEAQRSGRFDAYKKEVAAQNQTLRQAIRCGDGYVESKSVCDRAAVAVSKAATSLETAATVLQRYR